MANEVSVRFVGKVQKHSRNASGLLRSSSFGFGGLKQLLERRPHAPVQLFVADHEERVLVSACEEGFLSARCIELVQAVDDVPEVHLRPPPLINAVKYVVPEELDEVPVSCLTPFRVVSMLWPLRDKSKLRHERE
eukprot:CAMPEP_0185264328 /NCGR_PEP_ID=MMETSP1359-20130426/22012_1 /TAXON_ID=552665 /ORGANISM="Bigelowiella longifila, Strain CCMP242" /LENGTH=134 /DNA_ID=CAMNT_0027852811 /DNA_START=75 /DNA_END=479 /DNA_ORIENTATION=-